MTFPIDIMRAATSLVFAGAGFLVAKGLPSPQTVLTWVVWIIGALLAGQVLTSTLLVRIADTGIYFNNALQGLGTGILLGFVVRRENG